MDYDGFFKQRLICSAVAEEVGSEVRTAGDRDNLLRGMREAHRRQPAPIGQCPRTTAAIRS
jgi:hypothetical protein